MGKQHRRLTETDIHAAGLLGITPSVVPANDGVHLGHDGTDYYLANSPDDATWKKVALYDSIGTGEASLLGDIAQFSSDTDAHIGTGGAAHAGATSSTSGFLTAADKLFIDSHVNSVTEQTVHPELVAEAYATLGPFGATLGYWSGIARFGLNVTPTSSFRESLFEAEIQDQLASPMGSNYGSLQYSGNRESANQLGGIGRYSYTVFETILSFSEPPATECRHVLIPTCNVYPLAFLEVTELTTNTPRNVFVTPDLNIYAGETREPSWSSGHIIQFANAGTCCAAWLFELFQTQLPEHRYRVTCILGGPQTKEKQDPLEIALCNWSFVPWNTPMTTLIPFSGAEMHDKVTLTPSAIW